jgi:hypothetical protein
MNKYLKLCLFGFLIWLIPFLVSFLISSLRETNRPLFESIMPIILTVTTIVFSILYLKKIKENQVNESILAGLIWFCISIIIDLIMFLPESPMQMTFIDYIMDIGITYLIIPIVAIGLGYMMEKE